MKVVVINRGLPGSGKSTRTRLKYPTAVVASADHWFERSGKYLFDARQLPKAHAACKAVWKEAMERGVPVIVVDNTHVQKWTYADVLEKAAVYGYQVEFEVTFDGSLSDAELAARNAHGVPESAIASMRAKWEW
jgi:predicted kinase